MKGTFVTRVVFGARGAEWCDINIECGKVVKGGLGLFGGDGGEKGALAEATSLQPFVGVSPGGRHGSKMSNL